MRKKDNKHKEKKDAVAVNFLKTRNEHFEAIALHAKKDTSRDIVPVVDGSMSLAPKKYSPGFAGFFLLLGLLGIPFFGYQAYTGILETKDQAKYHAQAAIEGLEGAVASLENFDLLGAKNQILSSRVELQEAKQSIQDMNVIAKSLLRISPYKGGEYVVDIAQNLAQAASHMTDAAFPFLDVANTGLSEMYLSDKIVDLQDELNIVNLHLYKAEKLAKEVPVHLLPSEYQGTFVDMVNLLPKAQAKISALKKEMGIFLELLGHEEKKRYMIVFQNNAEMRPSGGFMGSYAIVEVYRGNIVNIDIPGGGFYDLRAGIKGDVYPPLQIAQVNTEWEIQDANWFFDWEKTAQNIQWFYRQAGKGSVDGVIGVNTFVLEDYLKRIGGITLEDEGVNFTAQNFRELLQDEVEHNYDKEENKPKAIVGEFFHTLLATLPKDPENLKLLGQDLLENLQERNIQIYLKNEKLQEYIETFGWDGSIVQTDGDYLAVVHTNIDGKKTDIKIDQEYDLDIHMDRDGTVHHRLIIDRTHHGDAESYLYGSQNKDFMQVYLPADADISYASGFDEMVKVREVDPNDYGLSSPYYQEKGVDLSPELHARKEDGKLVVSGWMYVNAGENKQVVLEYTTKQKSLSAYDLYIQKQSGNWHDEIQIDMSYDDPENILYSQQQLLDNDISINVPL